MARWHTEITRLESSMSAETTERPGFEWLHKVSVSFNTFIAIHSRSQGTFSRQIGPIPVLVCENVYNQMNPEQFCQI